MDVVASPSALPAFAGTVSLDGFGGGVFADGFLGIPWQSLQRKHVPGFYFLVSCRFFLLLSARFFLLFLFLAGMAPCIGACGALSTRDCMVLGPEHL